MNLFKEKRKQMMRRYNGKNPYAIGEVIRDKQEVLEILEAGITYPITDVIEEIPVKEQTFKEKDHDL